MFYITTNGVQTREHWRQSFNRHGIQAVSHYVPLSNSICGKRLGRSLREPINSQIFSDSILRFPLYIELNMENIKYSIHKTLR